MILHIACGDILLGIKDINQCILIVCGWWILLHLKLISLKITPQANRQQWSFKWKTNQRQLHVIMIELLNHGRTPPPPTAGHPAGVLSSALLTLMRKILDRTLSSNQSIHHERTHVIWTFDTILNLNLNFAQKGEAKNFKACCMPHVGLLMTATI